MQEGDPLEVCDGRGLIVQTVLGPTSSAKNAPLTALTDVLKVMCQEMDIWNSAHRLLPAKPENIISAHTLRSFILFLNLLKLSHP